MRNTIKAFTLAEVLITLGIIGVVAAMTLPTLINSYKKQQTVTHLQKVYTS
ncbi:MAG: type II secretion system protein [Brachyspira sp.]|nr:type II secretion system protein [Brachyspira sp.]